MTEELEQKITVMRHAGFGYTTIAVRLELTKIDVRRFCKAHDLMGRRSQVLELPETPPGTCKTCGKPLTHTASKKKKLFCSDRCRMDWWNAHPHTVNRKAFYSFTCVFCGKEFTSYGNANRKYCSHACYINDRYSKEDDR